MPSLSPQDWSQTDPITISCHVCMVTHTTRVWTKRVRLPILLVVSLTRKMNISSSAFAPENSVSQDGFGSPVPRQLAHLVLRLNLVLTYEIPPEFGGGVHLFI